MLELSDAMKLNTVRIRNFKSIEDQTIELEGTQIIIGKNASGKTNLLEFFKLMKKLSFRKMEPHNPIADWWGFENIIFNFDISKQIIANFQFQKDERIINYEAILGLSPVNNEFVIISEKLELEGFYRYVKKINKILLVHPKELIENVKHKINNLPEDNFNTNYLKYLSDVKPVQRYEVQQKFGKLSLLNFSSGGSSSSIDAFLLYLLNENDENLQTKISEISPYDDKSTPFFGFSGFDICTQIKNYLQHILILRHPDLRTVRKPNKILNSLQLHEDSSNMCEILYRWYIQQTGKLEQISEIISQAFPGYQLAFDVTQDNRVFIIIHENGYVLKPANISDGFFKLLSILTAINSNPSILLIDEIDNSLYKETLDLSIDLINSENLACLITSHSPIVIDNTDLSRILICKRIKNKSTIFEKPKDIISLKKTLQDLKISWSDAWYTGYLTEFN